MTRGPAFAFALTVTLIANMTATSLRGSESLIERAFADYAAGDPRAISRIVPPRYFVGAGRRTMRNEIDAALSRWARERHPVQAVFLLELARFGLVDVRETDAVDVLDRARVFVTRRPDPPGRNPQEDAFEIEWHKAAIALLGGLRRPDVLEKVGRGPLRRRMTAKPPAGGDASLVDPWIELAGAILQEQRTILDPRTLASDGPAAIRRFDEAARYDENRSEALVRKSWLLIRLGRHTEALVALDAQSGSSDRADATVRYWSRLFRGRALASLARDDEAARAYEQALALDPGAQAPLAALTALEGRRGRRGLIRACAR